MNPDGFKIALPPHVNFPAHPETDFNYPCACFNATHNPAFFPRKGSQRL
jgi:hypothetical protein